MTGESWYINTPVPLLLRSSISGMGVFHRFWNFLLGLSYHDPLWS